VENVRWAFERQTAGFFLVVHIHPAAGAKIDVQVIERQLRFLQGLLPYRIEIVTEQEENGAKAKSKPTRAPLNKNEEILLTSWQNVLQRDDITPEDNFFDLGGDSILTIQVIAQAARHGLRITPKHFFENPTIAFLAKVADQKQKEAEIVKGPVPLTPVQKSLFEQMGENKINHFNTAMMFQLAKPLDISLLNETVRLLSDLHPNFRLRFKKEDGQWMQFIVDSLPETLVHVHNLQTVKKNRRKKAIEEIAEQAQKSFDIQQTPLFRLDYMDLGPKAHHRLLVVFHHLTFDGISWRTFIPDFVSIYGALAQGKKPELPPPSTPYTNWAQRLAQFANTQIVKNDFAYWQTFTKENFSELPLDNPQGANTFGSSKHITFSLTPEESQRFVKELPTQLNVSIDALFLAVLARTLRQWAGGEKYLAELYSHGRNTPFDDVDVSRTLGWFTVAYPFVLQDTQADWPEMVKTIDQQLKQVPMNGLSYGLLRYATDDPQIRTEMAKIPQPQINFNYLGQFDQGMQVDEQIAKQVPFRMAPESTGPEQHPDALRPAQLYLVGIASGQQLHIRFLFSKNVMKARTVKQIARIFKNLLQEVVKLDKS
jgi:non-ribosomal peptide synthase protein (TIGR01720 family)